ncbi:MAG TPA: ABC transporter permease, partial [Longimicrobiales bacterium]|nr:ABC transporter permease [Longimicrobiales bacterium]
MTAPGGGPPLDPRERVDEEIRHHLAEKVDLLVASGWDREEARREAERRFGSVRRIRRRTLQARRGGAPGLGETVRQTISDLRYALRGVRHGPGFTAALVATLALGIGAASSIFAVVDALLVRPMPYAGAERWVELSRPIGGGRYAEGMVGEERIRRWREAAAGLADGWVAYMQETLVRTDGPEAARLDAVAVTAGAEALLGIGVRLGRGFTPEDGRAGAPPVALLAEEYWRRLGADPGILGRTLHLESGPVTVVGVLRGGVKFPEYGRRPDLWLPLRDDLSFADRNRPGLCAPAPCPTEAYVWARLVPGLDAAAAQERFDVLARRLQERYPSERSWHVRLVPVGSLRAQPDTRRAIWTLTATVAALFLIALVNGVNLTLVRASTRSRELAVRLAVGASPG